MGIGVVFSSLKDTGISGLEAVHRGIFMNTGRGEHILKRSPLEKEKLCGWGEEQMTMEKPSFSC